MSTKKWELNLNEQRELRKRGSELLFDRVVLLVACYNDALFIGWCHQNDTNELDYLDDEINDTAVGFLTWKSVLSEYPTKEEWVKHNVRVLIAHVLEAQDDASKRNGEKRTNWKERALAAERECERLRAEVANMKETLAIVAGAKCAT